MLNVTAIDMFCTHCHSPIVPGQIDCHICHEFNLKPAEAKKPDDPGLFGWSLGILFMIVGAVWWIGSRM